MFAALNLELHIFEHALGRRSGVILLGVIFVALLRPPASSEQLKSNMTPAVIFDRAHSSVVVIFTADKDDKPIGQGSGFIVAKDLSLIHISEPTRPY